MFHAIRSLILIAVCLLWLSKSLVANETQLQTSDTGSHASSEDAAANVMHWRSLLSHDEFWVRESATRDLILMKPADVDLLVTLAMDPEMEVAWRIRSVISATYPGIDAAARGQLKSRLLASIKDRSKEDGGQEQELFAEWNVRFRHLDRKAKRVRNLLSDMHAVPRKNKDGDVSFRFSEPVVASEELFLTLSYVPNVKTINLEHCQVADDQLQYLVYLPELEKIYLSHSGIDGSGISHLAALKKLEAVSLRGLTLVDEAYVHLGELTNLKYLGLDETNLNDQSIAKLTGLTNVTQLWLNETALTDEGLRSVGRMAGLEKLILTRMKLNGDGLAHLSALPRLKYLSLAKCNFGDSIAQYLKRLDTVETLGLDNLDVSDNTIAELSELKNLRVLWVQGTKITDKCVPDLLKMKQLERLVIYDCDVTLNAIKKLKDGLPGCKVETD